MIQTAPPVEQTMADIRERIEAHRVTTIDEIYEVNGQPRPEIVTKHTEYLTPLLVEYLTQSAFYVLATANADGSCDVSPRGDAAGAVRVLDERTLVLPDRPGNRRVDSLRNIISNPYVGLLFIIPPVDETLRINGRAIVTKDPDLLATMPMRGKTPKLAIVVEVDEAYMHCARAFLRSGLWRPETWPDPDTIPTLAAIASEQKQRPAPNEAPGTKRQEAYRDVLY